MPSANNFSYNKGTSDVAKRDNESLESLNPGRIQQ